MERASSPLLPFRIFRNKMVGPDYVAERLCISFIGEKRLLLIPMNEPSAGEAAKIRWLIKPLREQSRERC